MPIDTHDLVVGVINDDDDDDHQRRRKTNDKIDVCPTITDPSIPIGHRPIWPVYHNYRRKRMRHVTIRVVTW